MSYDTAVSIICVVSTKIYAETPIGLLGCMLHIACTVAFQMIQQYSELPYKGTGVPGTRGVVQPHIPYKSKKRWRFDIAYCLLSTIVLLRIGTPYGLINCTYDTYQSNECRFCGKRKNYTTCSTTSSNCCWYLYQYEVCMSI